jgi:hypothetical protein
MDSCENIEYSVGDRRQKVVLQLGCLTGLKTPYRKSTLSLFKVFNKAWELNRGVFFEGERSKKRKIDIRFGTYSVGSLRGLR